MNFPKELRYTESHEWAKQDGDSLTVGITDYAQHELGDIVYVELPQKGKTIKKGEIFGAVESVKAVSDLFAPVSGKIIEANQELSAHPEYVNHDPYGKGWLIKIAPDNPNEINTIMDAAAYEKFVEEEAGK
ncbi:MAG TPA: glycine cleavage system protein GcvH [bacterium]